MIEKEKKELTEFIEAWEETEANIKKAFLQLKNYLEVKEDAIFSFKARPGVSYSLRAACPGQKRELFVMADVIDDDPENRWLSVCFYGDMISDPEERGDLIPEGLLGQDGYCFDIDEEEDGLLKYIEARLDEAYQAASS